MKTLVFGASGFIGSHVAEQLLLAGHAVCAVIRAASDASFLNNIGVTTCVIDFSDDSDNDASLINTIKGHEVVYNCLANPVMHLSLTDRRQVEVELTRRIVLAAGNAGVKRLVQLSTVQVYGFSRPPTHIDEDHPCHPSYHFNQVAQEREVAVREAAASSDIELVMARPVNTIGKRDSSMKDLFRGHRKGFMLIFGNGKNRFSCVDTRDIGRAMVLLGELPEAAGNTYLISGYETTWLAFKAALDKAHHKEAKLISVPVILGKAITTLLEKLTPYNKALPLVPFSVAVMSTQTLFDDKKIRAAGFTPKYDLQSSIADCLS